MITQVEYYIAVHAVDDYNCETHSSVSSSLNSTHLLHLHSLVGWMDDIV